MTTASWRHHALAPVLDPRPEREADPSRRSAASGGEIKLVAPDAVPEGARILGLVVAIPPRLPGAAPVPAAARPLSAVRALSAPADDGLLRPFPGLLVDRRARRVHRDGKELSLTRREYELLEHFARHPDRVFTRPQLLAAVWDFADIGYAPDRTVDVHVARLRRKLGPEHSTPLESLRGIGYRWSSSPTARQDPS